MSILNNNKPVAHLGRSSFDLSSTHAFSMRPAVLRPVIVQDTVPDSAFEINCADLVRTSALQRAAFLRGKHELDFFFVPYNLVFSRFNDIVLERGDSHSPAVEDLDEIMPMLPLEHIYFDAAYCYLYMLLLRKVVQVTSDSFETTLRAFNHTFSGDIVTIEASSSQTKFLRQFIYNDVSFPLNGNFTINDLSFVGYDVLALLDTLGYGNYGSTIYDFGTRILSDFVDDDWTTSVNSARTRLTQLIIETFRNNNFNINTVSTASKFVNGLRLFCYQKVFYDRFRDTIFDNNLVYPYAFSADYDVNTIVYACHRTSTSDNLFALNTILRPRLRTVKKDLVSGLYPSSQFGSVADQDDLAGNYQELQINSDNPNSAYGIRFALALQKYRETLLRAGSRSKDVLKALFGVESRYMNDTYVQYLGSFSGQLDLNKVSATAETGSYSVGDLAANVFSSLSGDTIRFTCNDYGVIIGVMSFFPELLHNNYGLSPHVLKSEPLHYYKEQFEDLGLQNVPSTIVNMTGEGSFQDFTKIRTLGFSARYYEYKTNLDFAHDQFGTSPLGYFDGSPTIVPHPNDGFNSNYVVTRDALSDVSISDKRNYLLPHCMDSLFVSLDTGDISSYHFDVILDCRINAVLPMSQLGLPY